MPGTHGTVGYTRPIRHSVAFRARIRTLLAASDLVVHRTRIQYKSVTGNVRWVDDPGRQLGMHKKR